MLTILLGKLGSMALALDLGEQPGTDKFAAVSAALSVGFAEGWYSRRDENPANYYLASVHK